MASPSAIPPFIFSAANLLAFAQSENNPNPNISNETVTETSPSADSLAGRTIQITCDASDKIGPILAVCSRWLTTQGHYGKRFLGRASNDGTQPSWGVEQHYTLGNPPHYIQYTPCRITEKFCVQLIYKNGQSPYIPVSSSSSSSSSSSNSISDPYWHKEPDLKKTRQIYSPFNMLEIALNKKIREKYYNLTHNRELNQFTIKLQQSEVPNAIDCLNELLRDCDNFKCWNYEITDGSNATIVFKPAPKM